MARDGGVAIARKRSAFLFLLAGVACLAEVVLFFEWIAFQREAVQYKKSIFTDICKIDPAVMQEVPR